MQYSAFFTDVDLFAGKQALTPAGHVGCFSQRNQMMQHILIEALLRKVEEQTISLSREVLEAIRIVGKQIAQMRVRQAVPGGAQARPGGGLGDITGHVENALESDGDRRRYVRMWVVAFERKVFKAEGKQVLDLGIDAHYGQLAGVATQL
jgi:hypothetical protein